ncbi:MAG: GNAT family N-acetyltransferase [Rhizorhabdus sp.]
MPSSLRSAAIPRPFSNDIHVLIVDLTDADTRIGTAWDDLAEDAAEPNAFGERWFVMAGIRHLAPVAGLRLVEIWRGERLIGLVPLCIGRRYGRISVRYTTNWLHHHSFLGTPLVRRGEERAFWSALLGELDRAGWAPAFLHLTALTEDGPVHRGLVAAAAALGRPCDIVHRFQRAQLDAGLSPQAYYEAHVRKKKRKELKRLFVRLAEMGEVRTSRLAKAEEVTGWCDDFLALERSGWKGWAGSALASKPDTAAFFCDVLADAFRAGRLDMLRIDVNGAAVAMLVNFLTPPGSFSFKIAFDEEFARFSPGVLIQVENLQLLAREDIAWMDSCAVENHPMIDSLWAGRRPIIRVSVPLAGVRRRLVFRLCRAVEDAWAWLRRVTGR